jgi:ParB family chromosome partitioning protein
MASLKNVLQRVGKNLDESIGMREQDAPARPQLSPVVAERDIGRRPLRTFGRVDIDQVIPDPNHPRSEFQQEAIERLATSIREKGQLHPIRVRWSEEFSKWIIISGERRWRATRAAGLPTIDCFFQENQLSESEILEQQLVENLLREDLQPLDEAKAFSELMKLNHWNGKQVAEALRVHPSKVSRSLALLELPDELQDKVTSGELSARSAYELSKIPDETAQQDIVAAAPQTRLTRERASAMVRQRKGKKIEKRRGTRQVFYPDNDWQVTVSSPKRGTYFEMEQALSQALDEVRHYIAQGREVL